MSAATPTSPDDLVESGPASLPPALTPAPAGAAPAPLASDIFSAHNYEALAQEAKNLHAAWEKAFAPVAGQFLHPLWQKARPAFAALIQNGVPMDFLKHPEVAQMFCRGGFGEPQQHELNYLRSRPPALRDLLRRYRESNIGHPTLDCRDLPISVNSLGMLYYFARIVEAAGVGALQTIAEFGGGYGCLCRVFLELLPGPPTYIIIDLPGMLALQYVFLKASSPACKVVPHTAAPLRIVPGSVNLVPVHLAHSVPARPDFFVSTFALSETPWKLQEKLARGGFWGSKSLYLVGQETDTQFWKFAGLDSPQALHRAVHDRFAQVRLQPYHFASAWELFASMPKSNSLLRPDEMEKKENTMTAPPSPSTSDVLIFSKDRPLQLDGTLRSWMRHCRDAGSAAVKVLYKASTSCMGSLYRRLMRDHPNVDFVREGDFRRDVLMLLRDRGCVLCVVDDTVFIQDFKMADIVGALDRHPEVLGFSLRLGRNTTYCYTMNHPQKLPDFQPLEAGSLKYRWPDADYDFGYPLELSSSVYRSKELLLLLDQLEFQNPNSLEDAMSRSAGRFRQSRPFLACCEHSAAFSIPANKVQQVCDNRAGGNAAYSAGALAALFARGQRIQTQSFDGFIPEACHQEVELKIALETEPVPMVTVIVPCYKQAQYLREAVASVVAQTFADWELIIVNDGSPDDTSPVASQLMKQYAGRRIRLLEKKNGGLAHARNAGIRAAAGAYILPLDADDKIEPAMLEKTVALLEENTAIAIAYSDAAHFGAVEKTIQAGEFDSQAIRVNNQLNYCSLFRREAWELAGGYNSNLIWGYEDWDFWIGCAEQGLLAQRIPGALLKYRVKDSSMFTNALAHDRDLRARIVLNHPALYDAGKLAEARAIWRNPDLPAPPGAPRVSVIVPAFNRPEPLEETLRSLAGQTLQDFEVIVVNGDGLDLSHLINRCNAGVEVVYLRCNLSHGRSALRNHGLRHARGRYIAFLDEGDLFLPNHLETLVNCLENSGRKAAFTDAWCAGEEVADGNGKVVRRRVPYSDICDNDGLLRQNSVPALCFLHERRIGIATGEFDELSRPHEDWDYWVQLSRLCTPVHINEATCQFRMRRDVADPAAARNQPLLPISQVCASQRPPVPATPALTSPGEAPQGLPQSTEKPEGFSFCIITNGKRPKKLAAEIASIRALQIPVCEILVGGDVAAAMQGVITVPMPEAARAGRLGEMRNRLMEHSRYDHLVMADDDLLFQPDFYQGLRQYGDNYEVLCVRFLNLDGTRFWDWATIGGPRGHRLLEYNETDPNVYVTGGLCVMKAAVAARVRWDEKLGFYQAEDVDFSRRLHEAGISIKFNPFSTVVHTDARYTQMGSVAMNAKDIRDTMFAKEREGKLEEASALYKRLRALNALGAGDEVVNESSARRVSLPVRWRGPVFDPCGYATEAINYLLPLAEQVDLGLLPLKTVYSEKYVAGLAEKDRAALFALRDKYPTMSGGIVIDHAPAYCFSRLSDAVYQIGRTMFETDRIPKNWVPACNQMDEIWVPSKFNLETFAASGVERDKLVVMPQSLDEKEFDPAKHQPLPLPNRAAFNFLSVFVWSQRKGWDVLLAAYLREFSAADDVCLYLRTYLVAKPDGDPTAAIERLIREHAATLNLGDKPWPRIEILAEQTPQVDLPRLYKAADCLVAPSRGEGWGRPHHEAMMMGLPVIATNWSGNTEFMNAENSYLLDYELGETRNLEASIWLFRGQRWANPSEKHLRQLMRRVQQNPAETREIGRLARCHMLQHYSRPPVTDLMVARLREIERKLTTPACPAVTARCLELPAAQKTQTLRLAWEGSFLDLGSLSLVNRELTRALGDLPKLQVTLVSPDILAPALAHLPDLQKSARLIQRQPPRQVSVTVRHAWPPNWQPPASGAWMLIQPWEYGVLPADWAEKLKTVDEVWVPSEYVRRVYVDSGVDPQKVKIVPNGVDPEKFNPASPPMKLLTRKTFKFLFVGGTIHRKGPDLLLEAYLNTFTAADDICLVIKDFGGKSAYAGQTFENQIKAAQSQPGAPEILYLNEELPPDAMPCLYTACDCLVHPYRGEGFGLPVLEAMACGLPVIVTSGGATDDFAGDEQAWRIASRRRRIGPEISGMKLLRNGWLLEPDLPALSEKMKWVARNPQEARRKGRAASDYVRREWTWQRAAQIAARRLHDLAARQQAQVAAAASPNAPKSAAIVLPETAKVGHLGQARLCLQKKDFPAAWNQALSALTVRPFHCEAFLLLAQIAQAAGDMRQARTCAESARQLAPRWKPVRQFIKSIPARPGQPVAWPSLPEIPASPRLTVCLITKNEEKFLEQCLQSVRELAHQIVVVDTGSTDRTVEIAKKFNADVHFLPWKDDFSAARNEALRHATGDWVLSLDADEELLPEHRPTLLREMQAPEVMGFRLPIIDKGREREGCNHVPRLFRNAPGLFFVGRVHEQVFSSLAARCQEWGLQNILGRTTLLHHGYLKDVMASRDKIARNLRLLQLALEEMPGDPNLLMNLGLELIRSGQLEAGLEQYIEALNRLSALPGARIIPEVREALLSQLTLHLLAARDFAKVMDVFNSPAAHAGSLTASHHFGLGLALMELHQPAQGAEQMRQCLAKRGQPALTPVNPAILKAGPNHCLARCLMALHQMEAAGKAFAAALSEEPSSRPLRFDFARFHADEGRPLEALKLLNGLVAEDPKDAPVWEFGGQLALSRPDFLEFARNWTGAAMQHFPNHPALLLQRAEALFLTQDMDGALPLWRKARSANPARQMAALVLCEFLAGDCLRQFTPADEPLISREALKWYRQLIAVGAHSSVNQLHERMDQLRRILPGFARTWEAATRQVREKTPA